MTGFAPYPIAWTHLPLGDANSVLFRLCHSWGSGWDVDLPSSCEEGMGFPGGSVVKNHLLIQEMWVRPLIREDPLEKERATHSSIFAWRMPWMEEPGGLQPMGSQRVRHDLATERQQRGCRNETSFFLVL